MTEPGARTLPGRTRRRFRPSPTSVLLVGLLLLLALTSALPLARLLLRGLAPEAYGWVLESSQSLRALANTLRTSIAVAILATGAGAVLAFLLERFRIPAKVLLRVLIMLPLAVPPHILALAWLSWAGPRGIFSRFISGLFGTDGVPWTLYGEGGIILLLAVFALPVTYLTMAAGLSRVPASLEEAAQLDGATPVQTARFIVLPLLRPHLLAGMMLAFLAAAGNFGITALLGIPGRFSTLPTLIYQRVTSFATGGLGHAAALALLLAVVAAVALGAQYMLNRGAQPVETHLRRRVPAPLTGPGRLLVPFVWACALFMAVGPFAALILTSLSRAYGLPMSLESLDFRHYAFVLTELQSFPRALANSLMLATASSVIAAGLAVLLGYVLLKLRRSTWLQLMVDLPYALPGIVFGLAMILAWLPSPVPGLRLYGTIWLLGIAYVGHYLAFALQPVGAAWRQVDPQLEEAAQLDGAGLFQTVRWVFLPLLAPTVVVATLLVFLNAVSEISLSALLAGSGTETLGWLIYGLEQAGTGQQAAALSVVLLVILAVVAALAWAVRSWAAAAQTLRRPGASAGFR